MFQFRVVTWGLVFTTALAFAGTQKEITLSVQPEKTRDQARAELVKTLGLKGNLPSVSTVPMFDEETIQLDVDAFTGAFNTVYPAPNHPFPASKFNSAEDVAMDFVVERGEALGIPLAIVRALRNVDKSQQIGLPQYPGKDTFMVNFSVKDPRRPYTHLPKLRALYSCVLYNVVVVENGVAGITDLSRTYSKHPVPDVPELKELTLKPTVDAGSDAELKDLLATEFKMGGAFSGAFRATKKDIQSTDLTLAVIPDPKGDDKKVTVTLAWKHLVKIARGAGAADVEWIALVSAHTGKLLSYADLGYGYASEYVNKNCR